MPADEKLPQPEEDAPRPNLIAQQTRRELFDVLVAEEVSEDEGGGDATAAVTNPREADPSPVVSPKGLFRRPLKYMAGSVQASAPPMPSPLSPPTADSSSQPPKSFLERMMESSQPTTADMKKNHRLAQDPYQDFTEGRRLILSPNISANDLPESLRRVKIPTLRECQNAFYCEEADEWLYNAQNPFHKLGRTLLNIIAAFYIWIAHTLSFESFLVIANATIVTYFYCHEYIQFAVKLDFAFLSFSVVFPLTFLINTTFGRRDQALQRLADFRACCLSAALFTFTVDWPDPEVAGSFTGGRKLLPPSFNEASLEDFRRLLQLVYEYLSMPSVSHARHVAFWHKQPYKRRIHSVQNDLLKKWNDIIFDFSMHTEEMRKAGFPSGEASRLHQYHQYLEQRFEHLRMLKYYRTPQATRSFGRVYIFVLPWLTGPYFAWVFEEQLARSYAFTLVLAGFTFLVLQGLLNTQQGLEDPFLIDFTSFTPGIDALKLDYEMAVGLQAVEQYFAEAQIRAAWDDMERKKEDAKNMK